MKRKLILAAVALLMAGSAGLFAAKPSVEQQQQLAAAMKTLSKTALFRPGTTSIGSERRRNSHQLVTESQWRNGLFVHAVLGRRIQQFRQ